jgi:hypothetical protein
VSHRALQSPRGYQQPCAPNYGWFTEGFDTRDLKEANILLDELHARQPNAFNTGAISRQQPAADLNGVAGNA